MTTVAATNPSLSTLANTTEPLLPLGTDPEAALAILEVREGTQAEQADRSSRQSDELLEEHEDDAAVQAMHNKASLLQTQGWTDFGLGVMTACVQASDAAAGDSTPGASSSSQDGALMKAFQGLCDGILTSKEANDDADVKGDQAAATVAQYSVQSDNQALGDASDLVKAALSAYQQYVTTEAQTQAAAIHRA